MKTTHSLAPGRRIYKQIGVAALSIGLATAPIAAAGDPMDNGDRWYLPAQVDRGEKLFAKHCARCHGDSAQGATSWQTRDEDGRFPPPPLNGTAHTWHHPLPLLRMIVREGSVARGGKMPGFADTLSDAEVDAVIAWLQSLWSNEIYGRWSGQEQPLIPLADRIQELLPEAAR